MPAWIDRRAMPAIGVYLALVGTLLWLSLGRTGGMFVYAQDDPYIHLALARTLAEHGVWGIRPNEFASASSSPLWTLLLATLWKLGAHAVWAPFALNILFGVVFLGVCGSYVARTFRSAHAATILCALVVITPLPTLALIGMEHTLQALLVVVFAWQAAERLAGEREGWLAPSVVAALMVATRYESLFLVAVVGTILLWQGQLRSAIAMGLGALVPSGGYALYSLAHGGLALPNSVLMKSGPEQFGTVAAGVSAVATGWLAIGSLFARPPQLALTLAVLGGLLLIPFGRLVPANRTAWFALIFLGTSILHACLVKIEWFFRYDAYLVALGLLAAAGVAGLVEWPAGSTRRGSVSRHPATVPLLIVLALPLGIRGLSALATTASASASIYRQQVQVGLFLQTFYAGRVVAVNDIGAVAWYSSSPLLDIVGLATQPVADLKRRGQFDAATLRTLADERDVDAIAVYEEPFAALLPPSWVKVGEWTTANATGISAGVVTFLARTEDGATTLRQALDAYAAALPDGMRWTATGTRVRPSP